MDYFEVYKKRLEANGTDVGDSLRKNTHYFKDKKFKTSTSYRRSKIFTNMGTDKESFVEEDIRVIEIDRQGTLRNILFRPNVLHKVGNILEFDGDKWLAYDTYGSTVDDIKLRVGKINDTLRWKDTSGRIIDIPSITSTSYLGSGSKANDAGLAYNVFDVRTPVGKILIAVELNELTTSLRLGQRFICGSKAYKLEHVDDISYVDSDYYGVLQLTLKEDIRNDTKDNFETGIAYQDIWNEKDEEEDEGGGW